MADRSGPERLVSRLSGSPFGWPRQVPRSTDACSQPDERFGCSIQQFKSISFSTFYIVGFCLLFRLWDFVLWDFVLCDSVRIPSHILRFLCHSCRCLFCLIIMHVCFPIRTKEPRSKSIFLQTINISEVS